MRAAAPAHPQDLHPEAPRQTRHLPADTAHPDDHHRLPRDRRHEDRVPATLRWRVTKWGTPWFSMRSAVIAYSPPLGMCTPLALVSTTSGGRSGTSFSTPALVDWIHFKRGARA